VRFLFRLFLEGDDRSAPMGMKAFATSLNANCHRTRAGGTRGPRPVYALLARADYAGRMGTSTV
jgi:hypothetical protein